MPNKRKIEEAYGQMERKGARYNYSVPSSTQSDKESVCSSEVQFVDEMPHSTTSPANEQQMEEPVPSPGPSTSRVEPSPPSHLEPQGEGVMNVMHKLQLDAAKGKNIDKTIASRWQDYLKKGISKEKKIKLYKRYLVPRNCPSLLPPELNPGARDFMPNFMIIMDKHMYNNQQEISIALTALAYATELHNFKDSTNNVLKPLSDACRLLCDAHLQATNVRRIFVHASTKHDFGKIMTDQWLVAQASRRVKVVAPPEARTERLSNSDRSQKSKKSRRRHGSKSESKKSKSKKNKSKKTPRRSVRLQQQQNQGGTPAVPK